MYLLAQCSKQIKLAFLQCMEESLTSVGLVPLIKQHFSLCGRQMPALSRTLVVQQADGWGVVSSKHLGVCAPASSAASKTSLCTSWQGQEALEARCAIVTIC